MRELALRPQVPPELTEEQLALIRSTVAKGATQDELNLFLYRAKNLGLDPLKPGQIYFIKYGNNPGAIVVGIDGFRSKAMRTGQLRGINRGVLRDANGLCIGAWCEVFRADWDHPAREEVSLVEYNTNKAQWAKMPETMIKKVAEAAALRMAFPDDLGGLYAEEEMDHSTPRDVRAKAIEAQLVDEMPEIELEPDFLTEAATEPPSLGEYLIKAGKNKGKCLQDLSPKQIEGFVQWAEENLGPNSHRDVLEYFEKAKEYLATFGGGSNE